MRTRIRTKMATKIRATRGIIKETRSISASIGKITTRSQGVSCCAVGEQLNSNWRSTIIHSKTRSTTSFTSECLGISSPRSPLSFSVSLSSWSQWFSHISWREPWGTWGCCCRWGHDWVLVNLCTGTSSFLWIQLSVHRIVIFFLLSLYFAFSCYHSLFLPIFLWFILSFDISLFAVSLLN